MNDEREMDELMEREQMTNDDIVKGLRSADGEERQKALDALFHDKSGALLLWCDEVATYPTTTKKGNPAALFMGCLAKAQDFGKQVGMVLGWLPDPEQQAGKLEIVQGGQLFRG